MSNIIKTVLLLTVFSLSAFAGSFNGKVQEVHVNNWRSYSNSDGGSGTGVLFVKIVGQSEWLAIEANDAVAKEYIFPIIMDAKNNDKNIIVGYESKTIKMGSSTYKKITHINYVR